MKFLDTISALFSGKTTENEEPLRREEYKGFVIEASPLDESPMFRVNGTILKDEKVHTFIRADQLPSKEACADEMIRKAKQMIDQQGENIFN